MSWDPTLLRKYSSTNHYKLLNQVRSDLKEQPIQRSSGQGSRRGSGGSTGSGGSRRRSTPVPQPVPISSQSTPANSFDAFVTVPVLIESFE
ncbi:MAG: hypothetical protein RLZZ54_142 [Cyanobacteriota bacterium]|jgi:hypothetical protein